MCEECYSVVTSDVKFVKYQGVKEFHVFVKWVKLLFKLLCWDLGQICGLCRKLTCGRGGGAD